MLIENGKLHYLIRLWYFNIQNALCCYSSARLKLIDDYDYMAKKTLNHNIVHMIKKKKTLLTAPILFVRLVSVYVE